MFGQNSVAEFAVIVERWRILRFGKAVNTELLLQDIYLSIGSPSIAWVQFLIAINKPVGT